MEDTVRALTISELMHLRRIELCDLAQRITNELPKLLEGSKLQHCVPRASEFSHVSESRSRQ